MNEQLKREEVHCEGCGAPLQADDPERSGYVPQAALEREHIICKRCFRIRHYNDVAPVEHDADAYMNRLQSIGKQDALVVQVVDLFDFAGSWINGIGRHTGGNPILILANKVDLFPRSTKRQKLKEWVYRTAKEQGVKPVDVILISAEKGHHIQEAAQAIEEKRRGRDVYVVGTANAGKSTFINALLREFGAEGEASVTTSPYPGTTLDAVYIPLGENKHIVDMPGIVRRDRMSEYVAPKELKAITPQTEIKPKGYQLNAGQTLFFGGLVRFDFREGERQPFVCYFANSLYIHRTKLEKADELWEKQRGQLLVPPADPKEIPPMKRHRFPLTGKEKEDLVIPGLGWVSCGTDRAQVDVWVPEGIQVQVRPSII
ncbi:ribosome biogenesis GTPase YqeH [Desmospora profundinema]|uniref:Ribosome biogenesis GTPase YqeH n=1 Tax=Desmospora profundinema TaxID=1571184 RepID=A0ABU1IK14_9BACL|nr:ribosome biogenesis GTPase YqeH [Desmospora profundinema]MDR6225117.1 ribosome biogenesis GTPase YqeH [Desmospora profundinema]